MPNKSIKLKAGNKVKICTCGHSKIIPYCDDSHREINEKEGTNYKSLKITSKSNVELDLSSKTWGEKG